MSSSNIWKKIGIGAAITGGVVAGVALFPAFLGFGTAGIVGGSIAAGIQSIIGNVAAGSLFAVCTSLGMTGVFASSAAVGAILGVGGLAAYIKGAFSAEKDAKLIHATIENRDNPDIIIRLLEVRFPSQREEIRQKYQELYPNANFNGDIINYIPINVNVHAENLLRDTNAIHPISENVRELLNNQPFGNYFQNEFLDYMDALLIEQIIQHNDNPLLIIRLLNYRNESLRQKIDLKFRELRGNRNRRMIDYILDFMPNHPEVPYLHQLLE
jgi:hypothetical protein